MTNEELQQQIERLEQQITELRFKILESKAKKKSIPYRPYEVEVPEDIEDYYTINRVGCIQKLNNVSKSKFILENIYQRGLAFKTREEAEKYDKERILLFKLHKWAEEHNEGWTPKWEGNGVKWYVMYETDRNILKINWCVCCRQFTKLPYFKSEEIAKQFIEEFGEEIKEVLC